jgi:hypothetical protein
VAERHLVSSRLAGPSEPSPHPARPDDEERDVNEALEQALATIRPSLGADGYDLRIGESADASSVEVILEASPDACADCLVPDDVLVQIIQIAANEQGDARSVHLRKVGFDSSSH